MCNVYDKTRQGLEDLSDDLIVWRLEEGLVIFLLIFINKNIDLNTYQPY